MSDLEPSDLFKGPVTSCEYLDENKILIGCGPYLSLVDDNSLDVISKFLALKYRVVHKIVINPQNTKQICVFGQKSLNLVSYDENENYRFFSLIGNDNSCVELEDWIFDVFWMCDNTKTYLVVACAHNQCILYDVSERKAWKISDCDQKCMLYSAKIISLNQKPAKISPLENLLIISGTIYNQILLWSPMDGSIQVTLDGHQGVIFNIEFSHYTNFLYTASDDRSINVWSLELEEDELRFKSGSLYARFYGHDARVWKCVAFQDPTSGLEYLCSVGEDLNVCLWSLKDKSLRHRFNAMRKGSKNIWSVCVNRSKMQIVTGWADGGLRKYELKTYLHSLESDTAANRMESSTESVQSLVSSDFTEWNLNIDLQKDFIRNLVVIEGRLICCTNLGNLNLIETRSGVDASSNQKLLFKSILLSNYTVMAKTKVENKWLLAIGTLKGFVYLLSLRFASENSQNKDEITINCINLLSIEEELSEKDDISKSSVISPASILTAGATKIFNLIWYNYEGRHFLLACFSLINGLMHLYELDKNHQLHLLARLFLPNCKQRWLTSYSIIVIQKLDENREPTNENIDESESEGELIYLIGGDKCGNLHLFRIEKLRSQKYERQEDSEESYLLDYHRHLSLIKPIQSMQSLTKENASIASIYSRNTDPNKYTIICCCQDGFYRVFEFDLAYLEEPSNEDDDDVTMMEEEEVTEEDKQAPKQSAAAAVLPLAKTMLKIVNKYQLNSYIDIIEAFLFEEDSQEIGFDLERSLKLALCFYGDKFLLWSFHLSRSLFEFKCGGANRSWDYEFEAHETNKEIKEEETLFRFFYIKNKSIGEARKLLQNTELRPPVAKNHFAQLFHGNSIKACKFLNSRYLFTGSEDTLVILSRIESNKLVHLFHLQGHDSVVKCLDYCEISPNELILVSAGGKANIKLWRVVLSANRDEVEKITHLYEFKRFRVKKNTSSKSEKPWLYIDLKSNPDMRFMDVRIYRSTPSEFIISFACSDGYVRIFRYLIELNKLDLISKYSYPKCLLCLDVIRLTDEVGFLMGFGTDGTLLSWRMSLDGEDQEPRKIFEGLHQSGVNDFDLCRVETTEEKMSFVLASVGEDTRISLLAIDVDRVDGVKLASQPIRVDMAHASSITGVKFIRQDVIATVSKDQRLVIWKIDYNLRTIKSVKVVFVNVADITSMDIVKLENSGFYRFSLVGVGLEIIHLKIDSIV